MQKSDLLRPPPLAGVPSAAKEAAESTKPALDHGGTKSMPNRLRFAPSVAAIQVSQSEWRLWGALHVSGRYRGEDVLVLVEIAEDAEFNQIIHKGKAIANKQNNFAVNYTYLSPYPDKLLFYRFKTIRMRVKDGTERERKMLMSSVGEMSPWKQ